jgi:hypothetical protein
MVTDTSTCIVVHLMLMHCCSQSMLRGDATRFVLPDLVGEVLRGYYSYPYSIVDPAELIIFLSLNATMLVAFMASIDFHPVRHSTVSLNPCRLL